MKYTYSLKMILEKFPYMQEDPLELSKVVKELLPKEAEGINAVRNSKYFEELIKVSLLDEESLKKYITLMANEMVIDHRVVLKGVKSWVKALSLPVKLTTRKIEFRKEEYKGENPFLCRKDDEGHYYLSEYQFRKDRKIVVPSFIKDNPVYSLGTDLFHKNGYVEEVKINEGIREVGEYCFSDCPFLREITFPLSLRKIDRYAFCRSFSLMEVNFPSNLEQICSYGFFGAGINRLVLPESVIYVGVYCFAYCRYLEEITLSSRMLVIPTQCFRSCYSLTKVDIPDGIEEIGEEAFFGCRKLKHVRIPPSVRVILTFAFELIDPEAIIYAEKDGVAYKYFKKMGFNVDDYENYPS
ncbi:MAG: leucine-rich repeat domain-containing protein [Bacilli bacterium]|nr:leucine-rich repeat domain-containing protein [Bacilli bacterium]